jgi:hypothetical protein
MRFERDDDNPETGEIKFEGIEREIVTTCILNMLSNASRDGGRQFSDDEAGMLDLYIKLLMPKHYNCNRIVSVRAEHLNELARTLASTAAELPEDQQDIAKGMASCLDVHRDILEGSMTEEEIDAQVSQIQIPDSIEGIA